MPGSVVFAAPRCFLESGNVLVSIVFAAPRRAWYGLQRNEASRKASTGRRLLLVESEFDPGTELTVDRIGTVGTRTRNEDRTTASEVSDRRAG